MLCEDCQSIFQGELKPVEAPTENFLSPIEARYKKDLPQFSGNFQRVFKAIFLSASQGCYICDVLQQDMARYWERLSRQLGPDSNDEPTLKPGSRWTLNWLAAFDGDSLSLAIDVRGGEDLDNDAVNMKWLEPYFTLTPTGSASEKGCRLLCDCICARKKTRRTINSLPISSSILSRMDCATHWLRTCMVEHPACNQNIANIAYPTRLLELNSPRPGYLRLRNTAEISIKRPYMTLSHRWGTAKFLRLTAATSHDLYKGIEASRLAQTFQEAAVVASSLGSIYLWIDSLCIFQDSTDDWKEQSAIMGDIYAGGSCNIAAIASEDSSSSTLYVDDHALSEPYEVDSRWTNRKNYRFRIHRRWPWKEDLDGAPLMSRGWVVQERILSPRILYLGKRQFFWECQSLQACQVFPDGISEDFLFRAPIKRAISTTWQDEISNETTDSHETLDRIEWFRRNWANALSLYTSCSLTKGSDKLIAISGIARKCGSAISDEYLAGHWKSDLPYSLLWARGLHTYCTRPEPYLAPSWSWASTIGPLDFPPDTCPCKAEMSRTQVETLVSVVDFDLKILSSDQYNHVAEGWVKLCGPLMSIELTSGNYIISKTGNSIMHYSWVDINGQRIYQEDFRKFSRGLRLDCASGPTSNLHYMPFLSRSALEHEGFDTWGLVLHPLPTVKGHFRRVGLLFVCVLKQLNEANGEDHINNPSWLDCDFRNSSNSFKITIF